MINLYELHSNKEKLDNYSSYCHLITSIIDMADEEDYSPVMHIIKKSSAVAYWYARWIIKDRWIEGEPIIKKSPEYAYLYAVYIIKDRFTEAENYIKDDLIYAYWYADHVIKDRWLEAEPVIMKNPELWDRYIREFNI